jgi:hypothetical protein
MIHYRNGWRFGDERFGVKWLDQMLYHIWMWFYNKPAVGASDDEMC